MKLLIIFVIICAFILMVAAVENEKSTDLSQSNKSLSKAIIDNKHGGIDRAAAGKSKKGRKNKRKGKKRGGPKKPKKGRRPSFRAAGKTSRKGHKAHRTSSKRN